MHGVQVCGRADVWGDGITPVETAHLPGAARRATAPTALHPTKTLRCIYTLEPLLQQCNTKRHAAVFSSQHLFNVYLFWRNGRLSWHASLLRGSDIIWLHASAGAKNITLEGVFHSPLGSSAAEGEDPGRPWYGSRGVLERWIGEVERDISELSGDTVSMADMLDGGAPPS